MFKIIFLSNILGQNSFGLKTFNLRSQVVFLGITSLRKLMGPIYFFLRKSIYCSASERAYDFQVNGPDSL